MEKTTLQEALCSALFIKYNTIRVIQSKRLRCAGHIARIRERRGAYRDLIGKPEERRLLGRPSLGLEDNIKMDL